MPVAAGNAYLVEQTTIWNSVYFAIAAVTIYEYIITLRAELSGVWGQKLTGASIIFLVNRYNTLLIAITSIIQPWSQPSCDVLSRLSDALLVAQFAIIGLFMALRVYAIWNRNTLLVLLFMAMNCLPVIINIYGYYNSATTISFVPMPICASSSDLPASLQRYLSWITRMAAILTDLLMLALTWLRLSSVAYRNSRIANLLLCDGALYFFALLVMNVSTIVVNQITKTTYMTPFVPVLTSVLISRFILSLRKIHISETEIGESKLTSIPASHFSEFLTGNLGESLA